MKGSNLFALQLSQSPEREGGKFGKAKGIGSEKRDVVPLHFLSSFFFFSLSFSCQCTGNTTPKRRLGISFLFLRIEFPCQQIVAKYLLLDFS